MPCRENGTKRCIKLTSLTRCSQAAACARISRGAYARTSCSSHDLCMLTESAAVASTQATARTLSDACTCGTECCLLSVGARGRAHS
eukprot:6190391-Pleurochrysis_carterae.AAC.3